VAPPGFVTDNTDCDDADPARHPGQPEFCDTIDNDCDGAVDNNAVGTSSCVICNNGSLVFLPQGTPCQGEGMCNDQGECVP
jgi:hypothetical protein